jgi:dGTPase
MQKREQWEARRSGDKSIRPGDHRQPSEKDLARLIHSAAFRRLQAKTQVLGIGEGDFHRTRLTHSMEAAQIGRGVVRNLEYRLGEKDYLPDHDLVVTICLAHDLGHPPFGHGGEIALNYMMREHGGFEGNGQTLRLLTKLEAFEDGYGLDFTRRALLGILKYPAKYSRVVRRQPAAIGTSNVKVKASDWKPPKCYHDEEAAVVEWLLETFPVPDRERFQEIRSPKDQEHGGTREKTVDCSIMELADDIAYGVHDLEDAIKLKLIGRDRWQEMIEGIVDDDQKAVLKKEEIVGIAEKLFGQSSSARKRAIGALVNLFITSSEIVDDDCFEEPLLRHRIQLPKGPRELLKTFKKFVSNEVIKRPEVQTLEYRGQQMVVQLFEAIASDPPRFLKENFAREWGIAAGERERMRVICDVIAGMTDEYATRMYERLFVPRHGTVFSKL